jgi:hypothetical protein
MRSATPIATGPYNPWRGSHHAPAYEASSPAGWDRAINHGGFVTKAELAAAFAARHADASDACANAWSSQHRQR